MGTAIDSGTRILGSMTFTQIPNKGKNTFSSPSPQLPMQHDYEDNRSGHAIGRLPKLNFPEFSGDNPKL
jgi:hypothetical protein